MLKTYKFQTPNRHTDITITTTPNAIENAKEILEDITPKLAEVCKTLQIDPSYILDTALVGYLDQYQWLDSEAMRTLYYSMIIYLTTDKKISISQILKTLEDSGFSIPDPIDFGEFSTIERSILSTLSFYGLPFPSEK